ncbi:hypothetical protein PVAP13_1KG050708 [Panicum virgatum]|uniref:Uncharacterized protein n=1 Tax=Panicum virgatum TaxID=38727 RepID=A0A8T0XDS8_PANVG|nr:hypothetical protein PVAP13_1KG050708 [Panicum virgatum]
MAAQASSRDPVGPRDRALRTTPGGGYPAKSPLHALGASLQDNKKSFLRSYGYWLCFPLAAMGFMVNGSKWWVIHTVLSSLQEKVGN